MNYKLTRQESNQFGVFGVLTSEGDGSKFVTLEHAYSDGAAFAAKLSPGVYTCIRHAPNRLPYETFMVTGVPNFQGQPVEGILIHVGNYNKDSEGCILVGVFKTLDSILSSKFAFDKFMETQKDVDSFTLSVQ